MLNTSCNLQDTESEKTECLWVYWLSTLPHDRIADRELSLLSITREYLTTYCWPRKRSKIKSEVQFLLNVHWLSHHCKVCKSNQCKLGTICTCRETQRCPIKVRSKVKISHVHHIFSILYLKSQLMQLKKKKKKIIQIGKEDIKPFTDDMIAYVENLKESIKILL